MALPHGDTVTAQHGVIPGVAVKAAVTEEAGGWAEEGAGEVPDGGGGVAGEVGTIDRLLARGKLEAEADGPDVGAGGGAVDDWVEGGGGGGGSEG